MRHYLLVSGPDRPGVTAALFAAVDALGAELLDVEQVVIGGELLLGLVVDGVPDGAVLAGSLSPRLAELGMNLRRSTPDEGRPAGTPRHHVSVLGDPVTPAAIAAVAAAVADSGGNIERIGQISAYPVHCYELLVAAGDGARLRTTLAAVAAAGLADVAVEPAGLARRAKRLVVLDVDSTLVQGEVIDLLAARAGVAEQVARVTRAAMAGEIGFAESLTARVATLAGLPVGVLDDVRAGLVLTPGARTLVRTLHRLGCSVGVVSGGFHEIIDPIAAELGLEHVAANRLEVAGGRLTGRVAGPIVDRAGKAAALRRMAAADGIALSQTVAVGDGANDLDMLASAGLGIAFNAKPVVREAADAMLRVPYLDAVLFLLGVSREDIEAADAEEGLPPRPPGPASSSA